MLFDVEHMLRCCLVFVVCLTFFTSYFEGRGIDTTPGKPQGFWHAVGIGVALFLLTLLSPFIAAFCIVQAAGRILGKLAK